MNGGETKLQQRCGEGEGIKSGLEVFCPAGGVEKEDEEWAGGK